MDIELRPYVLIVWLGKFEGPGEREIVFAPDLNDAARQVQERYGDKVVYSLYNEEDANRPRGR
jgi:hypothetical protein